MPDPALVARAWMTKLTVALLVVSSASKKHTGNMSSEIGFSVLTRRVA